MSYELGAGSWEMGAGSWEMGDGRWELICISSPLRAPCSMLRAPCCFRIDIFRKFDINGASKSHEVARDNIIRLLSRARFFRVTKRARTNALRCNRWRETGQSLH